MGSIIQAVCTCGLRSEEMFQGIGFSYPDKHELNEPAYCDHCGIVELKNAHSKNHWCSRCKGEMTFYNQALNEEKVPDQLDLLSDRRFSSDYLEKRKYWHCPRCGKTTLQFEDRGLWD